MATLLATLAVNGVSRLFGSVVSPDPFWDEAAWREDNENLKKAAARRAVPETCHAVKCADKIEIEVVEVEVDQDQDQARDLDAPSHDLECLVCQTVSDSLVRIDCGHGYCPECLNELFRSSMSNESLFPPRCCRQLVSLEKHRPILEEDVLAKYGQKKVEFETVDRTYCSSPRCSAFIGADHIVDAAATCPSCAHITCVRCKSTVHQGNCTADVEMQPTLDAAAENGWKRCYSCRRMVELETGCNHMTCLCGAQFCYVCGDQWKTCACPQFNADSEIQHDDAPVPNGERTLQVQIASVAARIRNAQLCSHDRWARVSGEHFCEQCYQTTTTHILECHGCQVQACEDCSGQE